MDRDVDLHPEKHHVEQHRHREVVSRGRPSPEKRRRHGEQDSRDESQAHEPEQSRAGQDGDRVEDLRYEAPVSVGVYLEDRLGGRRFGKQKNSQGRPGRGRPRATKPPRFRLFRVRVLQFAPSVVSPAPFSRIFLSNATGARESRCSIIRRA